MGLSVTQWGRLRGKSLICCTLSFSVWILIIWVGTVHLMVTFLTALVLLLLSFGATFHVIRQMQTQTLSPPLSVVDQCSAISCNHLIRCIVACGIVLWYFTMLLPVNIENKLTLIESLFYHGILVANLLLLKEVRVQHTCPTMLPENSSQFTEHRPDDSASQDYYAVKYVDQTMTEPIPQVNGRYSVLLDCLIIPLNHRRYVICLLMHLFFVYYTTNLALTSVCTPILFLEWFIVPRDCSSVYDDFGRSWTFVAALYGLTGSVVFLGLLFYEALLWLKSCHSIASGSLVGSLRGIWIS